MLDPNPGSSGIKTVLNKLLHKRGGSLDHFSGRDLARNSVWKETNFSHFRNRAALAEPLQQKPGVFFKKRVKPAGDTRGTSAPPQSLTSSLKRSAFQRFPRAPI
jgi:hypothetical protein